MQLSITVILATISGLLAEISPCPQGGCANFTLYLGPRWGAKIIKFPNYPKMRGPSEEEAEQMKLNTSRILNRTEQIETSYLNAEDFIPVDNVSSQHKPVPDDNSLTIDYSDTPAAGNRVLINNDSVSNIPNNLSRIGNVNDLFEDGTLNLTNLGIQGDEVKYILMSLNKEVREGLQCLYLDRNPLGSLYDQQLLEEFSRLVNLKVLGLSETSLRGLAPFDLPSVEVLDLSNNLFPRLPGIIYNLPNLRELDLSGNRIMALMDVFSNLDNLRILSLANNDMHLMSNNALESLYLDELYLNNNRFHMLYEIMLDPVKSPNVNLYLSGNPLVCDCYLQEDLLNRAWPSVADWDQIMCTAYPDIEPRLVSAFAEECHGPVAWLKLLPDRFERGWDKVFHALRRLGVPSPDDFMLVCALLIAILLVWVAFRIRRRNNNDINTMAKAKDTVPYTILDSKQVP